MRLGATVYPDDFIVIVVKSFSHAIRGAERSGQVDLTNCAFGKANYTFCPTNVS